MPRLTAILAMEDQISNGLNQAAAAAEAALSRIEAGAENAATAVDGAARSIDDLQGSIDAVAQVSARLDATLGRFSAALQNAMTATEGLNKAIGENESATAEQFEAHQMLSDAVADAGEAVAEYAASLDAGAAPTEATTALIEDLEDAYTRLTEAAREASEAVGAVGEAGATGGGATLPPVSESPGVQESNGLGWLTSQVGELEKALAGLGAAKMVTEAAEAACELANAFDAAQGSVVRATGATGAALDDLSNSMMDVFAAEGDLERAAGLVGELSTRFGLVGDDLEAMAGKFSAWERATGQSAVTSVRTLSQLTKQWGLETTDVAALMDKLTVAGQKSGISLNTLSSELTGYMDVFNQLGFSIDESIALLSQFELYGVNAGTAMMGVRQAVTKGAIDSSRELFEVFDKLSSGIMNATEAVELFGSRAGNQIAAAAQIGALELDGMVTAIQSSAGSMEATADAAETLEMKWRRAADGASAALTRTFAPAIQEVSGALADLALDAVEAWNKSTEGEEHLTLETENLDRRLQEATERYEKVVAMEGAESRQARLLRYETIQVSTELGRSKQTISQFIAEHEALTDRILSGTEARQAEGAAILEEAADYDALLTKMSELASNAGRTEAETREMRAIYDSLSSSVGDLGVSFVDLSTGGVGAVNEIQQAAERAVRERKYQNLESRYVASSLDAEAAEKVVAAATAQLEEAERRASEAQTAYQEKRQSAGLFSYNAGLDELSEWTAWDRESQRLREQLERDQEALAKAEEELASIRDEWQKMAADAGVAGDATADFGAKLESAFLSAEDGAQSAQAQLEALYDSIHQGSVSAIDSTLGLFNALETKSDMTFQQMEAGLASQETWLEAYAQNIEKAMEAGLDSDLLAQLADGSQKSAGELNEIISQYEAMGQEAIDGLNAQFAKVQEARAPLEAAMDTVKLAASDKLDELTEAFQQAIDGLDMAGDAGAAAEATISAYIGALQAGEAAAVAAAEAIAAGVAEALQAGGGGISVSVGVAGHATGTTDAEGVFVAGENGPELIVGAGGSTVFPSDETERIIGAVNDYQDRATVAIPERSYPQAEVHSEGYAEKKVTLEINGSGAIQVSGNVDKTAMLEVLVENVKPVLPDILNEEIFQEGDGTYDD